MNTNTIAIGIVSFERGQVTQRCIDSIRSTIKLPYHIYIADNGSRTEETKNKLKTWEQQSDISLIRLESNLGPSAGRNAVLKMAIGQNHVFAMLDNDIIVLDGWDSSALNAIQEGFDIVQPKLLSLNTKSVIRGPTRPWKKSIHIHPEYIGRGSSRYAPEINHRKRVELFGGTKIIRTRVFEVIGWYDPHIWVGEDYDLAFRASAAGFAACYEPKCEMIHDHPFDLDYEQIRGNPKNHLVSHIYMWEKHSRALLSPSSIKLYYYLVKRDKTLFIRRKATVENILERVLRKIIVYYFRQKYGEIWKSYNEAEIAVNKLKLELKINVII